MQSYGKLGWWLIQESQHREVIIANNMLDHAVWATESGSEREECFYNGSMWRLEKE